MNLSRIDVRCVQAANALLGESPVWDVVAQELYWADLERPAIYRYVPGFGQTGAWPMPRPLGGFALTQSGKLIFADTDGLGVLDPATCELTRLADPENHLPGNRFNDGRVDRRGRFWVGSIDAGEAHPTGSLYRLDPDGAVHRMDSGFICSNGIGWSPDNRTMYFVDSVIRTVFAYQFDLQRGDIFSRRVFASLRPDEGLPDGLAVDTEGCVWVAVWDGSRVLRYAPSGEILGALRIPVRRPTSCTFGGPELRTLFVTSATTGLTVTDLREAPLSGAVFSAEVGVAGMPDALFADEPAK